MIGAIIQARTSSTRLPGKVIKELPYGSGITALEQVIRRTKQAKKIDQIIVATTIDEKDISLVKIAEQENVLWFRGSIENVLERYFLAAQEYSLDPIVRITSDCPCIDPEIIDTIIDQHFRQGTDYTSNAIIRSYPDGFDVEVLTFEALAHAYQNAKEKYDREHVTSFVHNAPHRFKLGHVQAPQELVAPQRRLTLDTWDDYALLCAVFDYLYEQNPNFSAIDIMELFERKPWLDLINQKVGALSGNYV